jgi:hypothetical protein
LFHDPEFVHELTGAEIDGVERVVQPSNLPDPRVGVLTEAKAAPMLDRRIRERIYRLKVRPHGSPIKALRKHKK